MNNLITKEDIMKGNLNHWIKIVLIGDFGSGKSHDLGTFPNSLIGYFGSGEEDTIINKPELYKNLYGFKTFIPTDMTDTQRLFKEYDEFIKEARKLAIEKKVQTVGIDTLNYLVDYRWMYINQYQKALSRSGNVDMLKMYGTLSTWFKTQVKMQLMSLPCNVVICCHQKNEVEYTEELEGMLPQVKKQYTENPIVANILGSARNEIGGLASYIFYKEKNQKLEGGITKYKYYLRTNKGGGKNAKSRLNLPEVIDVTNKSLYEVIKTEIEKIKKQSVTTSDKQASKEQVTK